MKNFLFFTILLLLIAPVQAFEDCVIISDGKLGNFELEPNDIVDVHPIFSIKNEKNTIFIQPLKVGKTKLSLLKNNKDKFTFDIHVTEDSTYIDKIEGFEVLSIDDLEFDKNGFVLDLPPGVKE